MTDRGTKLSRAVESWERAREALERARGTATEADWREHVARAARRVNLARDNADQLLLRKEEK